MAKSTARNRTGDGGPKTRPIHVVRFGRIKAVVWLNQIATGSIHNVTVSRSYKKGEEWHETSSFGYEDLLTLAKAVNAAHSWIHGQRAMKDKDKAA